MKPFVRRLVLDAFVPEQPNLHRRRGVRQFVGRDRMRLLERTRQRPRDDGSKFGIDQQCGQGKEVRQRDRDPWRPIDAPF